MAVTIDSLEIQITNDSSQATRSIGRLVSALKQLKGAASVGSDLSAVAQGIRAVAGAAGAVSGEKVAKALESTRSKAKEATEQLQDLHFTIEDVSASMHSKLNSEGYAPWQVEMNNAEANRTTFGVDYGTQVEDYVNKENALKEAMEERKRAQDSVTESANRKATADERAERKAQEAAQKNYYKQQQQDAKQAQADWSALIGVVSKGASIAMKFGGKLLGTVTEPFKKAIAGYKRLVGMIKRMVLRRLIMAALRTITDGFKTGLENLYQYSYAINGIDAAHAYQSLDKLASISMYVKNSVGAAAMPIINIFIPALQKLASWAVMAANAVNQLVSAFTGGDTYTKAKEAAVDYMDGVKDSASGANKAAKDLKATLLGFDEINRLDSADKGSGSGGGGGGSAKIDYRDYFEPAKIDPVIKDLADQIKKKIKAGDWEGIGKLIATKLNEAIGKIDAKAIGKKITTTISNGVKVVAGFLKATDFKQIGTKIGDFIDGAIDGIDAKAFADTISGVLTGTIDVMLGWIKSASTNGTGSKVATRLYIFLKEALKNIKTYLKDTEWDEVGKQLFQILDDFVKDFDYTDISNDFWNMLGHVWVASNTLKANFIAPAVNKWLTSIKDEFDSAKSKGEFDDIGWKIIKGVFGVFLPVQIAWAASSFYSSVVVPWLGGIGESLDGKDGKKKVEELSDKILTTIFEGISQAFTVVTYPLADIGIGILQAILGFSDSDRHKLSVFVMKAIKEVLIAAVNILLGDTALGQLGRKVISNFFDPIIGKTNTLNNALQSVYNNMKRLAAVSPGRGGSSGNTVAQANGALPGYYTQMKAEGGYVGAGQLFIANEAGPELVGTVNGRTAVAPNAEITGIANAVYATGEREVAAINNLIRALNAKDMTAVVTADSIVAGLARKNRRDGVSTVPVSV